MKKVFLYTIALIVVNLTVKMIMLNAQEILQKDSISTDNLIHILIEQNQNNNGVVNLHVVNLQKDTIFLRSSFFLDEPQRPSHILIYSCFQDDVTDSLTCNWGTLPLLDSKSTIIEIDNRRSVIEPEKNMLIEIPVRREYIGTEIYFKVQFLLSFNKEAFIVKKETNKIFLPQKKEKFE